MTYRNMRVKIDDGSPVLATRLSVDFSAQNQVKRQLAANIDANDQFTFANDVDCKISFDFLMRSDAGGYEGLYHLFDNYHGTGANGMVLDIGNNQYSGCYVDNFSLNVRPFEPVGGSVTFSCFSPSADALAGVSDDAVNDDLDTANIIYGHNCPLVNTVDVVTTDIVSSLSYSKSYSRTPVYTLGSQYASDQLVDGVEVDMSVESTGLNSFIDYNGNKLTRNFGVGLQDYLGNRVSYNGVYFDLQVSAGAHVVSESYSVNGGDTLVTKATIKEVIL